MRKALHAIKNVTFSPFKITEDKWYVIALIFAVRKMNKKDSEPEWIYRLKNPPCPEGWFQ